MILGSKPWPFMLTKSGLNIRLTWKSIFSSWVCHTVVCRCKGYYHHREWVDCLETHPYYVFLLIMCLSCCAERFYISYLILLWVIHFIFCFHVGWTWQFLLSTRKPNILKCYSVKFVFIENWLNSNMVIFTNISVFFCGLFTLCACIVSFVRDVNTME